MNETHHLIFEAAAGGDLSRIKYLVEQGADVDAQHDSGNTALIIAAWHGHREVVKYLVSKGANIHIKNKGGDDAVSWAAEHGHLAIVRFLVEHGADPNSKNVKGGTPLTHACEFGAAVETVEYLLGRSVDLEPRADDGFTPLVAAAYQGHTDIIDVLIEAGANIHVDDDAPLEWAALFDQLGSVECLLAAGADPDSRLGRASTALIAAVTDARPNRDKIINALLDSGADVNRGRSDSATALHEAAETGQVDVIKLLVERGADVAVATDQGDTPVIVAARSGQLAALCCLAELGADLDHKNANGQTARRIVTAMMSSLPGEKKDSSS